MTVTVTVTRPDHADIGGAPVLLSNWRRAAFVPEKIKVGGRITKVGGPAPNTGGWRTKKYYRHHGVWHPKMPDWLVDVVDRVVKQR